jgi:PHD/YefM family antitoxin component YafN of YafNO toxin-antitoxin module
MSADTRFRSERQLFESWVKTLEILADEELMRALRQSLAEVAQGETVAFEEVLAELEP